MMNDWHGLYSEGWQNEIVDAAFAHPAKFARGLIRRIYEHALEEGWLVEGDTVIDPFAGVGLGAVDALAQGLNWIGKELEPHFVDMGRGCECTGISKKDWVRCFRRWDRFRYKDGRHWCPRCMAEAKQVMEDWKPALPGMESQTAAYKRNSGKIPFTSPHPYTGNLGLFAQYSRNGARAILLQGDSRQLCDVLDGARAKGLISSPPYAESLSDETSRIDESKYKYAKSGKGQHRQVNLSQRYSASSMNLGNAQGDTFWSAARAIVRQCWLALAPDGVAIFVTKRFVRNGEIVEFSQQWTKLCESVGFELIEWIRAWLVEDRGAQYTLTGDLMEKKVKHFSFFRRLHAQKYPHLAIEWEDVLCFKKGQTS